MPGPQTHANKSRQQHGTLRQMGAIGEAGNIRHMAGQQSTSEAQHRSKAASTAGGRLVGARRRCLFGPSRVTTLVCKTCWLLVTIPAVVPPAFASNRSRPRISPHQGSTIGLRVAGIMMSHMADAHARTARLQARCQMHTQCSATLLLAVTMLGGIIVIAHVHAAPVACIATKKALLSDDCVAAASKKGCRGTSSLLA